MAELTGTARAAALHGVAENGVYTDQARLHAALAALDIYEQEVEKLRDETSELTCPVCYDKLTVTFALGAGGHTEEMEMVVLHGRMSHRGVHVGFSQVLIAPNDDER